GTLCSRSLCANFGFWILGILDFGFRGFWILDFRFWGFWILDFEVWGMEKFGCKIRHKCWMLHKKRRLCTPTRVGGYISICTVYMIYVIAVVPHKAVAEVSKIGNLYTGGWLL
ncbi:MAG: hypothetical protein OIF58_15830, partial [Cohaesibacter sp.]|nr:hypothetical protein [Cohaesibacter sp.]